MTDETRAPGPAPERYPGYAEDLAADERRDERRRSVNATARALAEQYLADLDRDPHDVDADRALDEYAQTLRLTERVAGAVEDARLDALSRWIERFVDRGANRAGLDDVRVERAGTLRDGEVVQDVPRVSADEAAEAREVLADLDDDAYEPDEDPEYLAWLAEQERRAERECGVTVDLGPPEDLYAATCERERGHAPAPHAGAHPLPSTRARSSSGPAADRSRATRSRGSRSRRSSRARETRRVPRRGRPGPRGSVGRLYCPMNEDGSPDLDNLGSIEVRWEDA